MKWGIFAPRPAGQSEMKDASRSPWPPNRPNLLETCNRQRQRQRQRQQQQQQQQQPLAYKQQETTRNKRETMAAARRHGANSLETNPKYPMKPEFFQSSTSLGLETVSKSNSDGADRLFWFACPFNSYITCEWFPLFIQFAGQISRALFFRCPLVRIDSAHFQRTDMNWI